MWIDECRHDLIHGAGNQRVAIEPRIPPGERHQTDDRHCESPQAPQSTRGLAWTDDEGAGKQTNEREHDQLRHDGGTGGETSHQCEPPPKPLAQQSHEQPHAQRRQGRDEHVARHVHSAECELWKKGDAARGQHRCVAGRPGLVFGCAKHSTDRHE